MARLPPASLQQQVPAQVVFQVECSTTKPGDHVVVTGGAESLGKWAPEGGVQLHTTRESFPLWSSKSVYFPPDTSVEYKYLITHPKGKTWESFEGNRQVRSKGMEKVTVRSKWGKKQDTTTSSIPVADQGGTSPVVAQEIAEGYDQDVLVAVNDAMRLQDELEGRELRRKNFSQSLLAVLLDESDEEPPTQVITQATDSGPRLDDQAARPSLPLKHIMSFSALEEMAEPDIKEKTRAMSVHVPTYDAQNLDVPVVIVTSEIAPYSKTGGLGLVAASYSYEFPRKGHRTMVVSPKYRHYDHINYAGEVKVVVNGTEEICKYWHKQENGCDYVFVEHPAIEKSGGLYNADDGREYPDNLFRFTLLSLAALEAPLILRINGQVYGQKVLFLANDWQASLIPLYLCHKYRPNNTYVECRCIYVVHNLGYQGQYPGVNACHFFGVPALAANDLAFGNCVNLCKAGLICCDRMLTVSPNYAKEIQTGAGGFRLEHFVKAKNDQNRLGGILNGIDDCWNPEIDKNIPHKYSVDNFVTGKKANKAELQKMLGLRVDERMVLIGFVGRLTWQKGVDVMISILDWLMKDEGNGVTGQAQLIMMGNGEKNHSDALRGAEKRYPGRVCGYVGFDPKVEHQMMAGCDLFLMPSRYEPCGLPQMYSQRYGCLPIVTATGGLVDSVKDLSHGVDQATGFHMSHLDAGKMKEVVYKAAELCLKKPADFQRMQRTAMLTDFYWPTAMDEYEKAIDRTMSESAIWRR